VPENADILQRLRGRIAAIEQAGNGVRTERACLTLGVSAIDDHLPGGGLATGAVHEILDGDINNGAKTTKKEIKYPVRRNFGEALGGPVTAFAAALAGRAQTARAAPVIWIAPRLSGRESLYGPGLREFGLDPAGLVVVRVPPGSDFTRTALWAMEEALRAPAVGIVCAEIEDMDLTASRRLQLAAEAGGGLGLLLRPVSRLSRRPGASEENTLPPTASLSRWRISALPGAPAGTDAAWTPAHLPGRPRWQAELLRARGGQPKTWQLEWRDDRYDPDTGTNARDTAGGFALVSPLRNRPLPQETARPPATQGNRRARTG
jgi:protein ImuA